MSKSQSLARHRKREAVGLLQEERDAAAEEGWL